VLGGVWGTASASPEPNRDGGNAFRGHRSRAGHRLVLDDSAHAKLVIAERGGALVAAGAFARAGSGPNAIEVARPPGGGDAGAAIATPRGDVELAATATLRIAAGRDVSIASTTTVDLEARRELTIAGANVAVTSRGSASVGAPVLELG
jgi:hypothetical protein